MDVFDLRNRLVSDYRSYTRSFIKIRDARIEAFVDGILGAGGFWPEPLLQLNPTFRPGGPVDELVELGILHRECAQVFRIDKSDTDHRGKQLLLHQHQREAILKAQEGQSYVLTTGTGSGKSLAYIVPIVDHVLRRGSGRGIPWIESTFGVREEPGTGKLLRQVPLRNRMAPGWTLSQACRR